MTTDEKNLRTEKNTNRGTQKGVNGWETQLLCTCGQLKGDRDTFHRELGEE